MKRILALLIPLSIISSTPAEDVAEQEFTVGFLALMDSVGALTSHEENLRKQSISNSWEFFFSLHYTSRSEHRVFVFAKPGKSLPHHLIVFEGSSTFDRVNELPGARFNFLPMDAGTPESIQILDRLKELAFTNAGEETLDSATSTICGIGIRIATVVGGKEQVHDYIRASLTSPDATGLPSEAYEVFRRLFEGPEKKLAE